MRGINDDKDSLLLVAGTTSSSAPVNSSGDISSGLSSEDASGVARSTEYRKSGMGQLLEILKNKTFMLAVAGGAANAFAMGGKKTPFLI